MRNRIRLAYATVTAVLLLAMTAGAASATESGGIEGGIDDLTDGIDGFLDSLFDVLRGILG